MPHGCWVRKGLACARPFGLALSRERDHALHTDRGGKPVGTATSASGSRPGERDHAHGDILTTAGAARRRQARTDQPTHEPDIRRSRNLHAFMSAPNSATIRAAVRGFCRAALRSRDLQSAASTRRPCKSPAQVTRARPRRRSGACHLCERRTLDYGLPSTPRRRSCCPTAA